MERCQEKFQAAIQDVQEKMDAELEARPGGREVPHGRAQDTPDVSLRQRFLKKPWLPQSPWVAVCVTAPLQSQEP